MSVGEERVRVKFNPSSSSPVMHMKQNCATLIDAMVDMQEGRNEKSRCAAIAATKFEEACLWAVKALTADS